MWGAYNNIQHLPAVRETPSLTIIVVIIVHIVVDINSPRRVALLPPLFPRWGDGPATWLLSGGDSLAAGGAHAAPT